MDPKDLPELPTGNPINCTAHKRSYIKQCRCEMHPHATGCYRCHLEKDHIVKEVGMKA